MSIALGAPRNCRDHATFIEGRPVVVFETRTEGRSGRVIAMRWVWIIVWGLGLSSALEPSPLRAQSDAGSDGEARALFEAGRAAYDAGAFDEATRAFRRAYLLSPRYPLLYNIGQAELRAGHDELALEAFEGYLRQAPADDPRRSEVEERVRVLERMGVQASTADTLRTSPISEPATEGVLDTSAAPTEPTPVAEADATEAAVDHGANDTGPGAAPWIFVGSGAALLVGGAIMMGVGVSEAERVTGAPMGSSWSELEGSASSANLYWGLGIGLAGVGLAAVTGGLVWEFVMADSRGDEPRASARLRVGPSSLSFEGTF